MACEYRSSCEPWWGCVVRREDGVTRAVSSVSLLLLCTLCREPGCVCESQRGAGTALGGSGCGDCWQSSALSCQGARRAPLWFGCFLCSPLWMFQGSALFSHSPSVLSAGVQGGWTVWCGHRDAACGVRDAQSFAHCRSSQTGECERWCQEFG